MISIGNWSQMILVSLDIWVLFSLIYIEKWSLITLWSNYSRLLTKLVSHDTGLNNNVQIYLDIIHQIVLLIIQYQMFLETFSFLNVYL